jgi:hypothetical protein
VQEMGEVVSQKFSKVHLNIMIHLNFGIRNFILISDLSQTCYTLLSSRPHRCHDYNNILFRAQSMMLLILQF